MVLTRDNGLQPVRRITVMRGDAAPGGGAVTVSAGALGNGMPLRDVTLSAGHRVLVTGEIAAMLFDDSEALIAARHLCGLAGVFTAPLHQAAQIELDHHEVILVNGCWAECQCAASGTGDVAEPAATAGLCAPRQVTG